MAGFTNPYGTGSGNAPAPQQDSQVPAQALRTQLNQQKQKQYGAKNGMAAAQAAPAVAPAGSTSPVTPTGQINQTVQPSAPSQPQFSSQSPAQDALTWSINNPTLGPDVTNQMKGALRDQAGLMAQQGGTQAAQAAASRGLSGGGWEQQQQRSVTQDAMSNLLGGFRDIDINAADTNRKNLLASLGIDAQNFGTRAGMLPSILNFMTNKDQTGLGYAQLNAQQQQALWNSIFGA